MLCLIQPAGDFPQFPFGFFALQPLVLRSQKLCLQLLLGRAFALFSLSAVSFGFFPASSFLCYAAELFPSPRRSPTSP
jgi:hypothetical protein